MDITSTKEAPFLRACVYSWAAQLIVEKLTILIHTFMGSIAHSRAPIALCVQVTLGLSVGLFASHQSQLLYYSQWAAVAQEVEWSSTNQRVGLKHV